MSCIWPSIVYIHKYFILPKMKSQAEKFCIESCWSQTLNFCMKGHSLFSGPPHILKHVCLYMSQCGSYFRVKIWSLFSVWYCWLYVCFFADLFPSIKENVYHITCILMEQLCKLYGGTGSLIWQACDIFNW
jgi:hypothetical protein